MDSDEEDSRCPITPYGMIESKRRLKQRGFHRNVTSKTVRQMPAFKEAVKSLADRKKQAAAAPAASPVTAPAIGPVVGHMYLGPKILEDVFRDGHQTAMKFSLTSSKMFKLTSDGVNRWDFCAMNYVVQVPSSVMVVVVPQHTVGDIIDAQKRYKLKLNSVEWVNVRRKLESEQDFDNYKLRSIEMEQMFLEWARIWRAECLRVAGPYWTTEDPDIDPLTTDRAKEWWDEDPEGINAVGSLKPIGETWLANQFEGSANKLHKMPICLAMESLFKLMSELHRARSHIEVLHLHAVPLVDRRMLAIMLRGLPHVTMVGVYNCPLIHFGDIIPLLDLIHEINVDRREKNMPRIKAFDFFPCFNQGMPYAHANAATYGISWGPIEMDIGQRGFYAIILKAVMKSKGLGLDLLFSPRHAFMDYLTKVPNIPLGVYGFLDAVYRYMEVRKYDADRCNLKLQAIYDMLKPIRVTLNDYVADDWPKYYIREMGKTFLCCSSCGYETFEDFFPANSKKRRARHQQTCCACLLQKALDEESDHFKTKKKELLDRLCPDWHREAFNQDAPLFAGGAGLIRLESTETIRPPSIHRPFLVDGLLRFSPYWQPLLRDQKKVYDSLVKLPSLENVALDSDYRRRWSDAIVFAVKDDVHRLCILELKGTYQRGSKRQRIPAYGPTREDGGSPDHPDEAQPPASKVKRSFFDHKKALNIARWMKKSDW
ncbi:hypothetical protein V8C35DRAFT_326562 [Trichoderma chlorosporum]